MIYLSWNFYEMFFVQLNLKAQFKKPSYKFNGHLLLSVKKKTKPDMQACLYVLSLFNYLFLHKTGSLLKHGLEWVLYCYKKSNTGFKLNSIHSDGYF